LTDKGDEGDVWERPIKKRSGGMGASSKNAQRGSKSGQKVSKRVEEKSGENETGKKGGPMAKNDEDRYVVKHDDGWAVKKENAERASGVFKTQKEAIDRAREIVNKSGEGKGEIRIQGKDGRFRDSDSGKRNETSAKDTK
jgi:hypothetical protein